MKGLAKYVFIMTGIIFLSVNSLAQETSLEALKLRLKNSKHDTTLVRTENEIAEEIYTNLPDSAAVIWERTIKLTEKHLASEDRGEIKLRPFYKKQLGLMLCNISYIYYQRGELKVTLENLERSLKINEELDNKAGIALSLNGIGYIYDSFGDVTRALEYFHRALKISEQINDKKEIGISLNNIGYMYDSQDDYTKALECYYQDLKLREEIKDEEGVANSLNNIGTILERQKKYEEALNYYNRSVKISESYNDKNGIALTLLNIGAIYERQNKFKEAMDYFQRSLKIREELKDKEGITRCDRRISKMYLRIGKYKEATFHAERSLKMGKELGFPSNIHDAAFILKEIYAKQNKYKEAFGMYTLQVQMNDSIYSQKIKKAAIKKQFQYAYEKKVAQDSIKHTEEQNVRTAELSAQEAQLQQEKTQRFVLYGGLLLVIGFSGFIFNRFKITQKQKEIIELQKVKMVDAYEKLHEKNKEVMDSINYAKRIQNSLLPSEKYITRILEKKFKA
jgi:tetratricopeptide (TPR) repeat protein